VDELYRDYRIAISRGEDWTARITHVRGSVAPFSARASLAEGADVCARRARELIDRYIEFLELPGEWPPGTKG
jgi:hypothetical protein